MGHAVEIAMRAEAIRKTLARVRSGAGARGRAAVILCYPAAIDRRSVDLAAVQYLNYLHTRGFSQDARIAWATGFVISLVGVIVSHIVVLFDFIEEKHAEASRSPRQSSM